MTHSKNSGRDFELYQPYVLLSPCYLELTLYHEAEEVATRALELNPRADLARHDRAMARWKLGNLHGAAADLDTLVYLRAAPFAGVRKARETVHELLRGKNQEPSPSAGIPGAASKVAIDPSWPHPNTVAAEPTNNDHHPCKKNEAGYFQPSLPCSDHNRSECLREDCPYSHIPDANSVRGIDGKNVCLRFLLGTCRRKECRYRHFMSGLPQDFTVPEPSLNSALTVERQWWNDPARVEEVRQHLRDRDARQKQEYEARVVVRSEKAAKAAKAQARALRAAASRTVVEAESIPSNENIRSTTRLYPKIDQSQQRTKRGQPKYQPQVTSTKYKKNNKKLMEVQRVDLVALVDKGAVETRKLKAETAKDSKKSYDPMPRAAKSFQRLTNCGFTDDDVSELTSMGVNPWDNSAQSVLAHLDDC